MISWAGGRNKTGSAQERPVETRKGAGTVIKQLSVALLLSLVPLAGATAAAGGTAGAKDTSFYFNIRPVVTGDEMSPREAAVAKDAADVLRDLVEAEIRSAYPCATTTDEDELRAKLSEEKRKQLAGTSDENGLTKVAGSLDVAYFGDIFVGSVGKRLYARVAIFDVQRSKAVYRDMAEFDVDDDAGDMAKTLQDFAKKTASSLNIKKCPAKYYFRGNDKAGRFNVVVEGFSRDGLFGAWDVYWTATAEGDGVTSKMFVKEDVLTSNEPDNLGDINGTGWAYQHMQIGDLEMESSGTITVGGTATIGGGTDDPTITLTMAKFAINTSGAGSMGNETFAQKATMSGSKGDATATGQIRGRGGYGKMDMMRPYFPEPRTYKVEKANGRTPPKTVPEPPKPAPAKKTTSADDDEDLGEDDRDWAAEKGPRVPSKDRTDPGDQDWAREPEDENPPDDR
jgi:hypothetical protein